MLPLSFVNARFLSTGSQPKVFDAAPGSVYLVFVLQFLGTFIP